MSRPSPSLAVSLLALFVALGGTGYAATRINGRQIVTGSITGAKLKRNTLGGRQIAESKLGKVPSASDADFLDGRPSSAYLLADGGTAANAFHLDGLTSSAFLPAGGTAVNASALGGRPPSAFLGTGATAANAAELGGKAPSAYLAAGATAVNADKLDGKDSTDFMPATRVQGAGPVTLPMPPVANQTAATPLITDGPFTLFASCHNAGGTPQASVGVQNTAEFFLTVGEADSHTVGSELVTTPATVHPVAAAMPSGGSQWDSATQTFSAVTNPAGGAAAALQGSATAIVSNGATKQCYLAAWAFVS